MEPGGVTLTREDRLLQKMAWWAGAGLLLIGLAATAAWWSGIMRLVVWPSFYHPLPPDAAVLLVVLGELALLQNNFTGRSRAYWLRQAVLGAVCLYTLLSIVQFCWGVQSLFEFRLRWWSANLNWQTGAISPLSNLLLFFYCINLLVIGFADPRRWITSLVAAAGMMFMIFEVSNVLGLFSTSAARNAAGYALPVLPFPPVCLLLGSSLVALAGKHSFVMRLLAGQSIRPRLLRTFLPLILSLVLLQSFISNILFEVFAVDHTFIILIFTLVFLVLTGLMIFHATGWVTIHIKRAEKDQARAEAALRHSEERFRLLYEQAPLGYQSLNAQGGLVEVNTAWLTVLGYARAEVIGRSFASFLTPHSAARFAEHFEKLTRAGEIHQVELEIQRKDAKILTVTLDAKVATSGLGRQSHWIFTDITARKEMEQALRAGQQQLALIFNHTTDIMLLLSVTPNGEYCLETVNQAYHNQAARYGIAMGDEAVLGRQIQQLEHSIFHATPDALAELVFRIRQVVGDRMTVQYEHILQTPGATYTFETHLSPIFDVTARCSHILLVAHDITARKQAEQQAQTQLAQLSGLHSIDTAITANLDLELVFNLLLEQALQHLKADYADILKYDGQAKRFEIAAVRGFRTHLPGPAFLRPYEGLAGKVVQTGRLVRVGPITPSDDAQRGAWLQREGAATYYGMPLIAKGQLRGVIELFYRREAPALELGWVTYLETLAGQCAIAMENAGMFHNLQRANLELTCAYDATIEGLAQALEMRHPSTEGQTRKMADLTLRLAAQFHLPDTELVQIRRGALLHDIGLLGVLDQTLEKTGPLTESEWQALQKHPENAYQILSTISFLKPALDIPYCHHEKWDGSGYPRGLKGEEIPLAARIFSVVDSWVSLRAGRSYREPWSDQITLNYIQQQAGSHFDPTVVQVFLHWIPSQQGQTLE